MWTEKASLSALTWTKMSSEWGMQIKPVLPPGGTRQCLETFSVDKEEVLVSGV